MSALEFTNAITHQIVFYVSQGHPTGVSVALFPETNLPFDLAEIEGEVDEDGIFRADLAGTDLSDERDNTVTRVNVYSNEEEWEDQWAEYNEGF